ncbi:hypothetical protein [Planococcus halotolerans]|uniref:Uncharacterized protein n=1 Tax=Planococcus halotolerans TaxID=2233542 RepID=A0A365KLW6_9BACL|nr:hypothetical protein [Planococcus halotolerans]QHJ71628.1 hypothetical protein DNR44_013760 [Planococcus halotolerans]RAZ74155.1 hypothetical protein DP120_16380 [Planococcus halotolerans]
MENKTEQTTQLATEKTITDYVEGGIDSAEKIIADQKKIQANLEEEVKPNAEEKLEETLDKTNDTLDEVEKNLEKREQELLQREVKAELKDKGLDMFADVINITDAKQLPDMVKKLTAIVNDIKVSLSYKPADNTKQDAYTIHEQNKDTKSMIGNKLANFFK